MNIIYIYLCVYVCKYIYIHIHVIWPCSIAMLVITGGYTRPRSLAQVTTGPGPRWKTCFSAGHPMVGS